MSKYSLGTSLSRPTSLIRVGAFDVRVIPMPECNYTEYRLIILGAPEVKVASWISHPSPADCLYHMGIFRRDKSRSEEDRARAGAVLETSTITGDMIAHEENSTKQEGHPWRPWRPKKRESATPHARPAQEEAGTPTGLLQQRWSGEDQSRARQDNGGDSEESSERKRRPRKALL